MTKAVMHVGHSYPPHKFLTVPQFAKRAKVSKILVYKWVERGHLMHYRFGTGPRATIVMPVGELEVARKRRKAAAARRRV